MYKATFIGVISNQITLVQAVLIDKVF